MKFFAILAATLIAAVPALAQDTTHAYMGTKKCSMCHKGEKKGSMFEIWQASKHAKAFETLASEEALKVYQSKGLKATPQTDDACLKCHITGHGVDATLTAALIMEEGVTCEACHGAGADYGKLNIMKDRALSVAAGLTADAKTMCVTCHNDQSPTFKGFKFEEMYPKIEHHVPPASE